MNLTVKCYPNTGTILTGNTVVGLSYFVHFLILSDSLGATTLGKTALSRTTLSVEITKRDILKGVF
jgi:hypothetical protein